MGDRNAGALAARRRIEEDERLRKKIFVHAYSLVKELVHAKELAQESIARAIDPERSPWDPDTQPDLFLHVGSLMNTIVANQRRYDRRHPTIEYDPARHGLVDPDPLPEDRLERAEDLARLRLWMDMLRARLADDPVALGKIDLLYEGVEDGAAQATRLACSLEEISRAHKRIAYHVGIVKAAAPDGHLESPGCVQAPGGPEAGP